MAADNNLSQEGVNDIDEMEAAPVDPEVQVVVQAEFSPTVLAQAGCASAACINRPNYNTFRYAISGQGAAVDGPNGPATDIGNRKMTDPAQLQQFIAYARQTAPSQHLMLVLWNHGGGYTGLLSDETTSPGVLMSIGQLPGALAGGPPIDVVDFDMCLMGGYETLVELNGLASFAVFSEELVPGNGNPYTQVIQGIEQNKTSDGRTIAAIVADAYSASYQGQRESTTQSAYDLAGFATIDGALAAVAQALTTNMGALRPAIQSAAAAAQPFGQPELKDIGNFLDSLTVRVSDATLLGQIQTLKTAVSGQFRVRNHAQNAVGDGVGGVNGAPDISRATGLNILLPSGTGTDQLGQTGSRSLSAYQALFPGRAWTQLLAAYLNGVGAYQTTDQGANRFESYLVWDTASVGQGADVDLWVLEPSGNLYIPYLGSVTPNGALTGDSYQSQTYYEGYLTNQVIQSGTYKLYANLYVDPQNHQPFFDLDYRSGAQNPLQSLYGATPPRLSTNVSWLNDPSPTFTEVDAGNYTDLQMVASVTFTPFPSPGIVTAPGKPRVGIVAAGSAPVVTPAQLQAVRDFVRSGKVSRLGIRSARRPTPSGLLVPRYESP
jgi:hypothetical protein